MNKTENSITKKLEDTKQKYPKIAKMTMKDVIETDEFEVTLEAAHKAAWREIRIYETRLRIISKHPIRVLEARKMFEVKNFRKEYLAVIDKESKLPVSQRQVIASIGSMAYTKAVELLMKKYDGPEIR